MYTVNNTHDPKGASYRWGAIPYPVTMATGMRIAGAVAVSSWGVGVGAGAWGECRARVAGMLLECVKCQEAKNLTIDIGCAAMAVLTRPAVK